MSNWTEISKADAKQIKTVDADFRTMFTRESDGATVTVRKVWELDGLEFDGESGKGFRAGGLYAVYGEDNGTIYETAAHAMETHDALRADREAAEAADSAA